MARYIDADALFIKLPNDLPYSASVKRVLLQAPTEDVVPREEVDHLRHVLDSYALQYGTVKDQHAVIDRIKAETAREIFEEIEKWLPIIDYPIVAELKKKYTEVESNG